jgi:PAS domain S-box-containing protein
MCNTGRWGEKVSEHSVVPQSEESKTGLPVLNDRESSTQATATAGASSTTGATSPSLGRLLRARRATLAAYLGASLLLSAAVVFAARHLPPLAVGSALMGALLAVGLVFFTRNRVDERGNHEPVANLRRELNHTRRGYKRLFTAVPCFICVLDRDHHILEANDLYRREFGATDRSLCYEVCKHRTSKCPDCIVDATFADGQSRSNEEVLLTRAGKRVNAVVHTRPIYDDDGEITSVMEVFTDITEVKHLQRQLALTGRAVASTAHRVKNILMGLEGGIFIVGEGLEEDDREVIAEGWEMVERNVERVSVIVKDLLYCAKEREPEFEADVCPQEIALEVCDLFVDRVAEDNIEIRAEVAEPFDRGTFDPEGLHSLLCNLVANAIDACRFDPADDKPGHVIVLRCRQNGDRATVFEVEDNGAGIPDDLNAKMFQDFFSSKGTEGTGIGLLVVQKVAEEHGGTVTFESKPGQGTVFSVTIPARDRNLAADPVAEQPKAPSDTPGKTQGIEM